MMTTMMMVVVVMVMMMMVVVLAFTLYKQHPLWGSFVPLRPLSSPPLTQTHSTLRPLTQTQTEPQQRLPRQTFKLVRMTMIVF